VSRTSQESVYRMFSSSGLPPYKLLIPHIPGTAPANINFWHQYCSKDCQTAHWKEHRKDCRAPWIKESWKPRWEQENRVPAFIGPGEQDIEPEAGLAWFGSKQYLWGNMPAVDILNLKENEGVNGVRDYALLFAGKLTQPAKR
jgi:hypothetical protein